mgnify:CR=1 FL=1|tara:strand:+ start:565 stop:819 length:255 start_codon:yes stop_codon:yes gene_type:complete
MDINEEEEFMKSLLDQLENSSWDRYMNLCYTVIMMSPDKVLDHHGTTAQSRIASLDKILLYFEEREDFEKCARLKDLQDHLKNC